MIIIFILISFITSCVCGLVTTPVIMDYCQKRGLYDIPNIRKVHKTKVPRLGGVAFLPCVLIGSLVASVVMLANGVETITLSLWTVYFMLGLTMIYIIGLIDDILGVRALNKLIIQLIAATMLPLSGLYINNLQGLFGIYEIPFYIGAPLTVIVVSFVSNSINLIDGIDGLSASLSIIALIGFLCSFLDWGLQTFAIGIAALVGVLVAFLYFNLLGKVERNRKIFMGDTGSLTLGFLLSFLSLKLSMVNLHLPPFHGNGLLISITLLLIPVLDAVRVAAARIWHHRPPMSPDKTHIHHKLMSVGLSQHQALLVIIGLTLFFILLNWLLSLIVDINVIVLADIVVYTLLFVLITHLPKRQQAQ